MKIGFDRFIVFRLICVIKVYGTFALLERNEFSRNTFLQVSFYGYFTNIWYNKSVKLIVWKIADFIFRLFAENSYLLFTTGLILYIDHLVQTFGLTFGRPVQYNWHVYRIFLIRKGLIWLHDMGDQVSKKARPLKADWVGKTRAIKRCELKLYFR